MVAVRTPEPTPPANPQPLKLLRARLPAALETDFGEDTSPRPGELPRHIFDFEDGPRLIVSMDFLDGPDKPSRLHVSASFAPKHWIWGKIRGKPLTFVIYVVLAQAAEHWTLLTTGASRGQAPAPLHAFQITLPAIAHFMGGTREEVVPILAGRAAGERT